MAREFSVIVGIDASRAQAGGRQFKAGADQVNRSSRGMRTQMNRTRRSTTALITTIGRLRGVATLAFAGFLGVGGISAVVRTLSQFQTAISQVTALISAQNPSSLGGAMAALTERARDLGATTLFTATQAAEGMRFLSLAGFDAIEVYQAIEPALNLAAAGMLGLGEAADIVSNIMAAFDVSAADTESVVNALAFTASRTNTDIRQLGQAMKFVGPVAGTLGIDVSETAVALGILGNSGLQASLAGTSLRRVMSGLLNPSKEAQAVFSKLGVTQGQLVTTMQGKDGLVNLVKLLALKGVDAADAFTLFGQRGAPGLLSLITQKDKLADLTKEMKKAGDVAARMAKILADNLGGDARIALSSLQEAILQLGDAGLGMWLRDVTQSMTGFLRALTGVKTPVDDFTEAMAKGAKFAELLKNNTDTLRRAFVILIAVMNRALIASLTKVAVGIAVMSVNIVRSVVGIRSMFHAVALLTLGFKRLSTAIASTGIGVLAVVIGYIVDYTLFSGEAEEATVDFTEALKAQREEAEKLIFAFDGMKVGQRKLAEVTLAKTLAMEKQALADAMNELQLYTGMQSNLVNVQKNLLESEKALQDAVVGSDAYMQAQQTVEGYRVALSILKKQFEDTPAIQLAADIEVLTAKIKENEITITGFRGVIDKTWASMKEYRATLVETKDAQKEFEDGMLRLVGLSSSDAELFKGLVADAVPAKNAITEVEARIKLFNQALENKDKIIREGYATEEEFIRIQKLLAFELKNATEELNAEEKAALALKKSYESIEERLDPVLALKRKLAAETKIVTEQMNAEGASADELAIKLAKLNGEYDDNITKLEETCDKTKELKECMSEEAKAMEALWDQALRNIQNSFADAFRGVFDDFGSFADSLLDAFKDLFANIAAEAAIKNIFGKGGGFFNDLFGGISQGIGGLFRGGGSAASSTSTSGAVAGGTSSLLGAGGALGSIGAGLQGAFSALTSSVAAFGRGALSFITGGGGAAAVAGGNTMTFATSGFSGAQNAAINNPGSFNAGGVAAGAGIGALTGAVVDAILGSRGDPTRGAIFAAIGGGIGSVFGGLPGAIIGGAIGALVDNIFGGAKKLEKATLELQVDSENFLGQTETIISKQKSFFRGRKFSTTTKDISASLNTMEDLFFSFARGLGDSAAALGGTTNFLDDFSATASFNIKGKNEQQVQDIITQFMERIMLQAVREFVNDVEGLPERVQRTLESFKDNVEEFTVALELLGAIENLFAIDLVKASADQIAAAQQSITQSYQDSLVAYRDVLSQYDGSIDALQLLTQATAVFTQVQLDLISVYQTLGTELSTLFGNSAQSIREQLLNEEELYNLRRSQISDLVAQAQMTTDPAELSRLAEEINRLGLDAFNLLDESQQQDLGNEFIEFFDGLDDLFGDQIQAGINSVVSDQSAIDQEVADSLTLAAQAIVDASVAQQQLYERWIRDFEDRGRLRELNR